MHPYYDVQVNFSIMRLMHGEPAVGSVADLNRLAHAVAVAREGSFAAAAMAIPMSQSALTRSVQQLERQYGVRLFDRRKNGSRLTSAGIAFIAEAEDILLSAKRAGERLADIARGENATVRFGVGPMVSACVLPTALPELATIGVGYQIRAGSSTALRTLLAQGAIDFYIGGIPKDTVHFTTTHGLRAEPLGVDARPVELFVRPDHPILERAADRADFPVAAASFTRERLGDDGFGTLGLQRPSFECDDYHAIVALIGSTDFMLVAHRSIRHLYPEGARAMVSLPEQGSLRSWQWVVMSSAVAPRNGPTTQVIEILSKHVTRLVSD